MPPKKEVRVVKPQPPINIVIKPDQNPEQIVLVREKMIIKFPKP